MPGAIAQGSETALGSYSPRMSAISFERFPEDGASSWPGIDQMTPLSRNNFVMDADAALEFADRLVYAQGYFILKRCLRVS
ncbi:MAG: hypothetical protein O3A14_11660, partial [Cyanobacteria bacterium]|nr:hypothetical protein [Cyanobacteriota bacterium]